MKIDLLLVGALLALTSSMSMAQSTGYQPVVTQFEPTNTKRSEPTATGITVSGKGYWRVNTDPLSRSTTIRFLSNNQQILYEEVLAGQYIELTDRNVARLDLLLNRISANNLVRSELKTSPLLPERAFYKDKPTVSSVDSPDMRGGLAKQAGIHAEAIYATNDGKLVARISNPTGHRMTFEIRDERDRLAYWDSVVKPAVKQQFNLSELPNGRYTLTVSAYNHQDGCTQSFRIQSGAIIIDN